MGKVLDVSPFPLVTGEEQRDQVNRMLESGLSPPQCIQKVMSPGGLLKFWSTLILYRWAKDLIASVYKKKAVFHFMLPRTLWMTGAKPVPFDNKGQTKGVQLKEISSQAVWIYEDTVMKFTSTERVVTYPSGRISEQSFNLSCLLLANSLSKRVQLWLFARETTTTTSIHLRIVRFCSSATNRTVKKNNPLNRFIFLLWEQNSSWNEISSE